MIFNLLDFAHFLKDWAVLYLFLLSASAAFWVVCRWVDRRPHASWSWFAASLVLGPLALSWLTIHLLAVAPGLPRWLVLLLLGLVTWPFLLALPRPSRQGVHTLLASHHVLTAHPHRLLVLALILLGLPSLFVLLAMFPPSGNDTLEYLQVGRAIFEQRSSRGYPILVGTETGGFLAPWTHPPGYPGLLALAFFVQGHTEAAGVAKMVVPWFVLGQLACVMALAGARRFSVGLLAALFLLGTPLYYDVAVLAHVDIPRIAGLTAAVLVAGHIAGLRGRAGAALLGLAIGLAMFTHSIGLLTLPLALLVACAVGLLERAGPRSVLATTAIATGVALVVVAPPLLKNLAIYGSVLQDHVKLWDIKELKVAEYLFATRFMITVWDRVLIGAMAPLTDPGSFGVIGFLTAAALVGGGWRIWKAARAKGVLALGIGDLGGRAFVVSSLVLLAFMGLAVLSALAGSSLIVKNPRYLLTIQPFSAVLAAQLLIDLVYRARRWPLRYGPATAGSGGRDLRRDRFRSLRARRREASHRFIETLPLGIVAGFATLTRGVRHLAALSLKPRTAAWLLVIVVTLWSGSQMGAVVYRDAVRTYGVTPDTFFDAEHVKRRSIPWPQVELESLIREHVPQQDRILTFRQSDMGFFLRRPMIVYFDDQLLPLYGLSDPERLSQALRAKGVRWIYAPGYPMAEIYNSAFGALLADPGLTTLAADRAGWRLYALLDRRWQVGTVTVRSEDFETQPELGLTWRVLRPRGLVNRLLYGFDDPYPPAAGPPTVRAEQAMLTRRNLWRTLSSRSWPDDDVGSAFLTAVSDFDPRPGKYRLEAEVEGDGLVEVALRLDSRRNLALGSSVTSIWSGVLGNERRKIAGVFLIEEEPSTTPLVVRDRIAQVLWRVHQRAALRVLRWRVEKLDESDEPFLTNRDTTAASRQGWTVAPSGELTPLPAEHMSQAVAQSRTGVDRVAPIGVRRSNSKPLHVTSPPLVAIDPGSSPERAAWAQQLEFSPLVMTVWTHVRGTALADVAVIMQCKGELLAKGSAEHVIPLGRVLATADLNIHRFRFTPPCRPQSIRLRYGIAGQAHRNNRWGHGTSLEVYVIEAALRTIHYQDEPSLSYFTPSVEYQP